jgi:uncharacterized protein (DUF1697 family)
MPKWIALFRAINVGGKNKMPMARLQIVLESMGCSEVQTYIQSGNVLFASSGKSKAPITMKILDATEQEFGFRPQLLLLTETEFRQAIEDNPFDVPAKEPQTLHFFFLEKKPPQPDIAGLEKLATKTEMFQLVGNVFYLYAPNGLGKSKLAAAAEKRLGVAATARNYNTIQALRALLDQTAK